jgi:tetratricopeptide (TPR) repeat protein
MRFAVSGMIAGALLLGTGPARTQTPTDWQCTVTPVNAWDTHIAGCTRAIQSGQYQGADLAWAYNNRGLAWRAKGDTDRAIADYNEAIRLDPKVAPPFNNCGLAWRAKGDLERAMADYNEAIRIDPKYAPPYINRGKARGDNGELDRAIADYDEAIRVDPKFALSYYNRGKTWSDKGELDRAIADYNEAIRLDPNFAVAYNNRGDTRFEKGDLERAIADYNEAIRIDPKFAAAYSNRGSARLAKGDLDRAIVDLNEAIRIDPSFVFAYNNRGEIWLEKGDLDRAVADFNAALKLNPKNAESLYGRGIAKLNKGDSAGSQADIQAATAINPDVADEFDATEVQFRFNVLTDIVVDRAKHKVEFFGMFDPRGPARRIPYAQFLANALQLPEESGTSGGIGSVPGFSLEPTIFRAWSHDDTLAIGRAFVSELKSFATGHDNLLLLPPGSVERVLGQRMWVRPTFFGIPANTAFARAVFESDVAFKSLVGPAGLKLKQDLPYHQALLEWVYQHCDLSAGSLFSIMVQPDNFQLSVAGDASFIRFDNAQLRLQSRFAAACPINPYQTASENMPNFFRRILMTMRAKSPRFGEFVKHSRSWPPRDI